MALKNFRWIVATTLVLIIVIMFTVIYVKKDNIFRQDIHITFPDGCIEDYVDGILVSPECTDGRRLLEEEENKTVIYGVDMSDIYRGKVFNVTGTQT